MSKYIESVNSIVAWRHVSLLRPGPGDIVLFLLFQGAGEHCKLF